MRELSGCTNRAQERTLLSSGIEKGPTEDLQRVFEYPIDSTGSFLRKIFPRRHQVLHLWEKKGLSPLEIRAIKKIRTDNTFV
jgi:hypothetical protein